MYIYWYDGLLGVFLATIAAMALGMLWYSPMLFGGLWLKIQKKTKKDISMKQNEMTKMMIQAGIITFVMAFVTNIFLKTYALDLVSMYAVVFLLWLGFIATVSYNNVLYYARRRKLYLIDITYQLVNLKLMATILYFF